MDGMLDIKTIGNATFAHDVIPVTNATSRPGYALTPTSITIHNTGNKNANAQQNSDYVDSTTAYVSWHFTVDDKIVLQELPINEVAWHAGDGSKGEGNRTSLAIEICENTDGDWDIAKYNAVHLIVYLLIKLGLSTDNVVPHQKWSGKYCPHKILDEGWDKFLDQVKSEYSIQTYNDCPAMYKPSYEKAVSLGIDDGIGPNENVTAAKMFTYLDKMGMLDYYKHIQNMKP